MRDLQGGSGCVYDADGSGSGGSGRREDSGFEAVTNSIILGYEGRTSGKDHGLVRD